MVRQLKWDRLDVVYRLCALALLGMTVIEHQGHRSHTTNRFSGRGRLRWDMFRPRLLTPIWSLVVGVLALATSGAAMAQNAGTCNNADKMGRAQLRVSQQYGRVVVELNRPNSTGRKVEIDYGDESYIGQFDRDGKARIGFALIAAKNDIDIRIVETPTISCKIDVPEFDKLYRVVMRWRDPIQLDLHVIEPGGTLGDVGDVSPARTNTNLSEGIGQMDVISGAPVDGATSETSYVVRENSAIPADSVFGFRAEYVTRGMKPVLPYCDDGGLAMPQVDLIIIEKGKVTTSKLGTNRLHCGDAVPENRRLMVLRP